ncbi:hypothetical protein ACQSSU_20400 [Micromonospora echinospora]
MVRPPALHDAPTAPEWWEIRDTQLPDDIAEPARFGDPAQLSDLERTVVAQNAYDAIERWHRVAKSSPIPTPPWKALLQPDSWSGHKLHVPAASLADVRAGLAATFRTAWTSGLGMKAATGTDVLATGKGLVIYLPRRDTIDRDASLIAAALAGYRPSALVTCTGGTQLAPALWWRHEFGGTDPGHDIFDPREYRSLYVPAAATT